MTSDTDRREVARRLRELNFSMSYRSKRDMWDGLRRIVGEYDDRPFGGVYTFARLADLIEPSCDRDALLELAEEINDTSCDNHGELSVSLGDIWGWAQEIRDALGKSDG